MIIDEFPFEGFRNRSLKRMKQMAIDHHGASSHRIAIIAGNGKLPVEVKQELDRLGHKPLLIGIHGEISEHLIDQADHVLTFGQLGGLFKILKDQNIQRVLFAGGVTKRPDYSSLVMDLVTLKEVPRLLKIAFGGDNSVLEKIAKYLGSKGLEVVGAHEVAPKLLAEIGPIIGKPGRAQSDAIQLGYLAAKSLGALDAGQAVIVEDGRIIALEAAEGTDAMIDRVAELRRAGRLSKKPGANVLVKTMKPKQDMRADLPTIGPDTIHALIQAGIQGVAVEAGRSILLERDLMIAEAKAAKLFVFGIKATVDEADHGK